LVALNVHITFGLVLSGIVVPKLHDDHITGLEGLIDRTPTAFLKKSTSTPASPGPIVHTDRIGLEQRSNGIQTVLGKEGLESLAPTRYRITGLHIVFPWIIIARVICH